MLSKNRPFATLGEPILRFSEYLSTYPRTTESLMKVNILFLLFGFLMFSSGGNEQKDDNCKV